MDFTIGIEARHVSVDNPSILAVMAAKPVLVLKQPPLAEGGDAEFEAALQILGVDVLGPADPERLVHPASRELEKGLVDEIQLAIDASRLDHPRCGVRHNAETLSRFTSNEVRRLRFGDVVHNTQDLNDRSCLIAHGGECCSNFELLSPLAHAEIGRASWR